MMSWGPPLLSYGREEYKVFRNIHIYIEVDYVTWSSFFIAPHQKHKYASFIEWKSRLRKSFQAFSSWNVLSLLHDIKIIIKKKKVEEADAFLLISSRKAHCSLGW